jgi:predicted transcriptional regulator
MDHLRMVSSNPPSDEASALGVALARLIDERGTNPNALAEVTRIPRSSVYRKIELKPETFTAFELFEIAKALGTKLSAIIREVEDSAA